MAQVTIYLPDEVAASTRRLAEQAGTSVSAYVAQILMRSVCPPKWPKALVELLHNGRGDMDIPEDPPPEAVEPLR